MDEKYDPKKQLPNPEIPEILRVIENGWADFIGESDYTRRKGYARVLSALLEQLCDEPEFLPADLQEDTVADDRHYLKKGDFDDMEESFLEERPFDVDGPAEDRCFFYTDTAMFSPLYPGPAKDPCRNPLLNHGPFVHSYEKRFATETETTSHVSSGEVLKRRLGKKRLPEVKDSDETHTIFCDPKGCGEKILYRGFAAGRTSDLDKAIRAATEVSKEMNVRLMVATKRISFCTR